MSVVIEQPGVYDLPAVEYHSDPVPGGSLSSSGSRKLLPPSCPALFHHWVTHGEGYNPVFERGHAAHAEVLGVGAAVVPIDAKDWRTKAAQAKRDEVRAAGQTPLLREEYEHVKAMAKALRSDPLAGELLNRFTGNVEQSLFWVDDESGVWRRAMLDYLPTEPIGDQYIIWDYKTCDSAAPGAISSSLANYGYAQQGAWYLDGFDAVASDHRCPAAYLLICQECQPPYLVTVVQPDPDAIMWGRRLNRKALDVYRECRQTDRWPGYSDRVLSVSLPNWATYQHEAAWSRGDLDPTIPGDVT